MKFILACWLCLTGAVCHAAAPQTSASDLQAQAHRRVLQAIRAQIPADLQDSTHISITITGERGAALHPCPSGWQWGDWSLERWQRVQLPVHCGDQSGSVVAQIQVQAPAYVAQQDLPKGTALSAEHLHRAPTVIQSAEQWTLPENWVGMLARRGLRQGQVVHAALLQPPVYAQRGERIQIQAGDAQVSASSTGIALAKGERGATIRARNVHSQTWVEGVLIAPGVLQAQRLQPGRSVTVQSDD